MSGNLFRSMARALLFVYAFVVPWEYSLDLGEPYGNIARIVGLLLLLVAIPAVFEAGHLRKPGPLQWVVLAFYLFWITTALWTVDPLSTFEKSRAYFQTMLSVWLVWELCDSQTDLRNLMRALVAGSWLLAILTLLNFASPEANAAEQIRFVAEGQDPNDVARFLVLTFPLAAYLFRIESHWIFRLLALGYLPLGLFAVLLTASRGGATAAAVVLLGSLIILARGQAKTALKLVFALPPLLAILWFALPTGVLERLATLHEEITLGNLNERVNIWTAGWQAFQSSPWFGAGAGAFVTAAHTAPADTAHNTPLTILVTGGLVAFAIATLIILIVLRAALRTEGLLRIALLTTLLVWFITSLVGTVEENRATWLLFALIAFAGRLTQQSEAHSHPSLATATPFKTNPAI
jgi:O-antigen ligase